MFGVSHVAIALSLKRAKERALRAAEFWTRTTGNTHSVVETSHGYEVGILVRKGASHESEQAIEARRS